MRKLAFFVVLAIPFAASAQSTKTPTTLRGVLLEQLHTTHDQEDWFVPANLVVEGLTAEQAGCPRSLAFGDRENHQPKAGELKAVDGRH
jgi:hypothetical protein